MNDPLEHEADAMADRVMSMQEIPAVNASSSEGIQRKCAECEEEEKVQRKPLASFIQRKETSAGAVASEAVSNQINASKGSGSNMDSHTQSFMQNRFGTDFSNVKIHTGGEAIQMNRELNAKAFTTGNDIYFNDGQYNPGSSEGKYLLAHELTHTVQQGGTSSSTLQRSCSDPDFCKPYATTAEADSAEWWIRNTYLRAEGLETFGTEVKGLYESYLSRTTGDSLVPVVFSSDESYIVQSFKSSWDTKDDIDSVIDLVGARLSRAPGTLSNNSRTVMSLSNFLSAAEMENRPINYSNPFSVAGHIAGGIGSSDAGDDYRKITYANVALTKVPVIGSTGYVLVELIPHYEVFDAIDFCPGDCGSPAEQLITVPMSRLEASGHAYDVPFKVIFIPDTRSKRFWY